MALINARSGEVLAGRVEMCDTFLKRGRGLMLRRRLDQDHVLVFVESRESVQLAAIHMLFVFFSIAVIWLDGDRRVVDSKLARPFRPYYAPARPARYYVEGSPALLGRVRAGDVLTWSGD